MQFFSYMLKQEISWNEMKSPGTSWDYLEPPVTRWIKQQTEIQNQHQRSKSRNQKVIGRNCTCNTIAPRDTTLAIVIITKSIISNV